MGKFRSKLSRNAKGKSWGRGMSSNSNPTQMKHRMKAQSRFFQSNLSLSTPTTTTNPNALTMEAVLSHEQRLAYNSETTTVSEVANTFQNLEVDDEKMSASEKSSVTYQSAISNLTAGTNLSFGKAIARLRRNPQNELHQNMLAIIMAAGDIIKERNGADKPSEYLLILMETLESATEVTSIKATLTLLSHLVKSIPAAVLQKCFSRLMKALFDCMAEEVLLDNLDVKKNIVLCTAEILRVQDYSVWSYSHTTSYFDFILSLTIHPHHKLRHVALNSLHSVIFGAPFMANFSRSKRKEESEETESNENDKKVTVHPMTNRITKFCLLQFKSENMSSSQTTILYTLTMLLDTVSALSTSDIRIICENLLSMMTAANVLIRTTCFQVFHTLFQMKTPNLVSTLCVKMLAAILEYRPDRADIRQTIAWLAVLKEGYKNLGSMDLTICMNHLLHFVNMCVTDYWESDCKEIVGATSNCLKELIYDCIKPACATDVLASTHCVQVGALIGSIKESLNFFSDTMKDGILIMSMLYEACGEHFVNEFIPTLRSLQHLYISKPDYNVQIEHAILTAIKSLGPEVILEVIPIDESVSDEAAINNSWILPLLREGITRSSFKFFNLKILRLANRFHNKSVNNDSASGHTSRLLCSQLWGLFVGFCRNPKDPQYFSTIAPTLGNVLEENADFRSPIYDGFLEILKNDEESEIRTVLVKHTKNFLPRLCNNYIEKPAMTYFEELRKTCLELIWWFAYRCPPNDLKEIFESGRDQLSKKEVSSFEYDSLYDITSTLILFQKKDVIRKFFDEFIVPVLMNKKSKYVSKDEQKLKKQQRRTYKLLNSILSTTSSSSCQKFTNSNAIDVQKLLLEATATSCTVSQSERLQCLRILLENRKNLNIKDKLVMKAIPEAVLSYKEFSSSKDNVSEQIIVFLANLYADAGKLGDFVDILTAGFTGDESLITNTILTFRGVMQCQGANMTISTVDFILQQILVFLVQRSRPEAQASVAFLFTFIKVMPVPLVANHIEAIMRSLSAMAKDTKRYCRIQLGIVLKKLCKRFTAEQVAKFVPGDDEVTHKRLKKIRKELRRANRQKAIAKNNSDDDSDEELVKGLEKKSLTIDDILEDSDSDASDESEIDENEKQRKQKRSKKMPSTFIREDPEEIVDLIDLKSIGNVLTNHPDDIVKPVAKKVNKDPNRGFKTAPDGRLIISEKALQNIQNNDDSDSDDEEETEVSAPKLDKTAKLGMDVESSDEEDLKATNQLKKKKSNSAASMRSGKTSGSRYTTGGKGIHRPLGGGDAMSVKSGYSAKSSKSMKSTNSPHSGKGYAGKKGQGDLKKKNKLDPYAYITLSRNRLNKRKRSQSARTFKSIVGNKKKSSKSKAGKVAKNFKK